MFSFRNVAAAMALAATAQATNTLTFVSTDNIARTIYITPSVGVEGMDPVTVAPGATVPVNFAEGFIGNAYAVQEGKENVPGMLAEVNFQGWGGSTYFDVSAIVNSADTDNIMMMYPADAPNTPTSGCNPFPCNNAYYLPDDVQTKVTDQTNLIVTLGSGSANTTKRDVNSAATGKNLPRNLVELKY
ncbi:DNAse1 protein [Sporothrix schenckii 1099-18]|uniref:DNAse1 protein n=2 Tax=Sporothrix schenckii TaxID=29908 RepID=U7Q3I0_SPOS1|nr:DNAse1 protein [Sporothrix schenckii 1099-18]ERT01757.1 hypothetical protein HMPREF1624_00051 [Sporothrix schenckii ATCC 58251]KJR81117.1 DNAse1 protein [Sporothrix schenckii 1099-18]